VYSAYQQPGLYYAAPVRWEAAGGDATDPAFRVDVFQQDRDEDGLAEFGLLTVRYAAASDLAQLYAAGIDGLPNARFEAIPVASGIAQLTSPANVALPAAVRAPQELEKAEVSSLALLIRLDGSSTDLLIGALRHGLATIRGLAWITAIGVAARMPGTISVDLGAFAGGLDASAGAETANVATIVELEALRQRVAEDPASLGIMTTATITGDTRADFADAALDRLLSRVAHLVPAPDLQPGSWVRIESLTGQASWDLAAPILVSRYFELDADPLGPLRSMPAAELEATLVRRHVVPPLRTGWHRVTFCPTMVLPQFGVADQFIEVTVAAVPPDRPQAVRDVVPLIRDEPTASVSFRLAPSEILRYQWSLTSVLESGTSAQVCVGPWRDADSAWTTIRPDDSGLRYITFEASRALLREADVRVVANAIVDGDAWRVVGTLDSARPAGAFVLPASAPDPELVAEATAKAGGAVQVSVPVVSDRLRLDPFSFPGAGPRTVTLQVDHDPGSGFAGFQVHLSPEDALDDPARHGSVLLHPQQPSTTWSWYTLSPFRSGVCWRLKEAESWSAPTEGPIVIAPTLPAATPVGVSVPQPKGT
jgi:hypothetical protein